MTLTLGPRGGGRQVPKMVEHVREAESAYVHQLGTKAPGQSMAELRRSFVEALQLLAAGDQLPNAEQGEAAVDAALRHPPIRLARPRPCLGDRGPQPLTETQISALGSSAVMRIGLPSGSSTMAAYGPSDFHGALRPT